MEKITYKQFTEALIIISRYASENEFLLNNAESKMEAKRNTPIQFLDAKINVRTFNVLLSIFDPSECTLNNISNLTQRSVQTRRNCGAKTIWEIKDLLESVNLTFKKP